jgi:hypothetical protein
LLDRDNSGAADTGVLADFIEAAGRYVDSRLAQRYGSSNFPAAQITDSPATPGAIQEIARHVVLWRLFARDEPDGRDARDQQQMAETWIVAIVSGNADIPDFPRASAEEGGVIAVYESEDPTYAGLDDDDVSRLRGI